MFPSLSILRLPPTLLNDQLYTHLSIPIYDAACWYYVALYMLDPRVQKSKGESTPARASNSYKEPSDF